MNTEIEIEISREDRGLLLKEVKLRPAIQQALRFGWGKEESRYVSLSLEEWDEVVDVLGTALRNARAGTRKDALYNLQIHLIDSLEHASADSGLFEDDEDFDEEERARGVEPQLHPKLVELTNSILQERPAHSIAEFDAVIMEARDVFLKMPLEDLGGLSMLQATALMTPEINAPSSPIQLCETLPAEEVLSTPIMRDCGTLLKAIESSGGLKLTREGSVSNRELDRLHALLNASAKVGAGLSDLADSVNLRMVEMLLQNFIRGDLLTTQRNKLVLSPQARKLLTPAEAPELYARLFELIVTTWGAIDDLEDGGEYDDLTPFDEDDWEAELGEETPEGGFPDFSKSVPFMLYQVAQRPGWHDAKDLAQALVMPGIPDAQDPETSTQWLGVFVMLFLPLLQFGLMEVDSDKITLRDEGSTRIRLTPLFSRFITIDWERVSEEQIWEDAGLGPVPE
jgi:hypothetical protein